MTLLIADPPKCDAPTPLRPDEALPVTTAGLRAALGEQRHPNQVTVRLGDLPGYLKRNAPAGESTLVLHLIRDRALLHLCALTLNPHDGRAAAADAGELLAAQDGDVLITLLPGGTLLCATLKTQVPRDRKLGTADADAD